MFPVDYEDAFFERVVRRQDGLESLAAVSREPNGAEQLIGFVTTRAFRLYECDATDRALLRLDHRLLDNELVAYILTLGVMTTFRQQGIASKLIQWVIRHAQDIKCRAVYLHVIAYNVAAIGLYQRNHFREIACRQNFYIIWSGRQPIPGQDVYDAFLYAFVIDASISRTPLSLLLLLLSPLRNLVHSMLAWLPWATPRGTYFGGGELPSLDQKWPSLLTHEASPGLRRDTSPPWLLSLFSRRKAAARASGD